MDAIISILQFSIKFIVLLFCSQIGFSFSQTMLFDVEKKPKAFNTLDIVKASREVGKVTVYYQREDTQKCKRLGEVKSKRVIEIWQVKRKCELIIGDLKREASLIGADSIFLEIDSSTCNFSNTKVIAYDCDL